MVLAKIATEVAKRGITYGTRFYRSDKQAWNKLYAGFPRYVKKGTREGFLVGSTIGGLLSGSLNNEDQSVNPDAFQKNGQRPTSSKQYQTHYRYRGRSKRRSGKRQCYCNGRPKRRY